jgi:hypothetical protein
MLLAAARRSCSRALALPGPPPVPVLPPWLPSVAPGSPGGGGRGVGFRGARCRRRPPLLPALPGGRGKFHVPGLAVLLGRCAGWLPRGVAVTRCGAPVQLQQHTGAGAARQHRQQAPATCAFGRGPSCLRNPTTASYRYDGCTWLSHDVPPTYPSRREETNMCPTISQSVTRRAASFAAGSTAKLRPLFG